MKKNDTLTRVLAISGTVFVWLPILAPIILAVVFFIKSGRFRFDYLMPAELFLLAVIGAILLFWGAVRAGSHVRLILWGFIVCVSLLVGSQAIAVVTGLASGAAEATGWRFSLVMGVFAGFLLAFLLVGVAGILLIRSLYLKAN